MIKVGIIGGAGYTAGELIRLLINHPDAEIVFINSNSNAGNNHKHTHRAVWRNRDMLLAQHSARQDRFAFLLCGTWRHTKIHGEPRTARKPESD